jgi:lactate dehydrogenase-like 2-hydroxyacid dehydrogenase
MFKKVVHVNINESAMDQKYWDSLDQLSETKVLMRRDDPNLLLELADCDCLLLGYQVDVQKDIIDAAPGLKYIGVLATAYGTIDIEYAASKDIAVSNLAGYSNESVAEFTIAILLWQMRSIQQGIELAARGTFDESGVKARELRGSQFGVIGMGSIGTRVAELASGFDANVSYWSRRQKESPFTYKDLDELLRTSDYISINIAEAPETIELLNASNIPLIKAGAVIVSTVPLSVIDSTALKARLAVGDITFISDHGEELSHDEHDEFKKYGEHVTFLPAIAYITDEARQAKQQIFITNIKAMLSGTPANKVN